MPLSNAERQKRYRERLKLERPEKFQELRIKHLKKVKEHVRKIAEMTEEEKHIQRQKWKEANYRRSIKKNKSFLPTDLTKKNENCHGNQRKVNFITALKSENEELKKKNRNLKRYKAQIKILTNKLSVKNLTYNIHTEHYNTDNDPINSDDNFSTNNTTTPITKTNSFLEELPSINKEEKEKVKKKILLLNTLTDSLKESYNNAETQENKTALKSIALSQTAKKYKMKSKVSSTLGLKGRVRILKSKNIGIKQHIKDIQLFFNRDDVSRASAGKQECITKNKHKEQKRYLMDTMQKLHAKYISEGGKASYVSFTRHRPFYVVQPRLQDRNTCGCIKHSNIAFKAVILKKLTIIQTTDMDNFVKNITCAECYNCMYSKCAKCINLIKDYIDLNSINNDIAVQWLEWKLKNHEYTQIIQGKAELKTVKRYIKEIVNGTVKELIEKFVEDLKTFKIHYYNKTYQYKAYRKYIENLDDDSVAIVCDFSEYYTCKLSEEIQAVHFQTNQITLHTCVLYKKYKKPMPICSISPVNEHGPGAIWAHLDPIFKEIIATTPNIKNIHIFSDGPTSQYRQKNNFFLFTKNLSDYGFQYGTWNYFEASHGKGPADGVGGAIKRKLDSFVAHGQDIRSAEDAFACLQNNIKIKIYFVTAEDVQDMCQKIPENVIPIKGTLKLHQVIYNFEDKQKIFYRTLSCICKKGGSCTCEGDMACHDLLPLESSPLQIDVIDESTNHVIDDQDRLATNVLKNIANTTKSNEKVTLLSSVKLTPDNTVFLGSTMLPFELRPIDTNFDIFTGHKIKKINSKPAQKRKNNTSKKNKTHNIIAAKRLRLATSSTSTESNFSVYNDSDLIDSENENSSDQDLEMKKIVTEVLVHKSNEDNQIETKASKGAKLGEKENFKCTTKDKNMTDIERNKTALLIKTDQELEIIKCTEYDKENVKQNQIESCESKTKPQTAPERLDEIEFSKESNEDLDMTDYGDKSKICNKVKNDFENQNITIGDTVLVRYFLKQNWKYFVGVVEHIDHESRMYSISFYKTNKKGQALTFTIPKRQDNDLVPQNCIVKVIDILQINENPEKFVVMNDEDLIYF